MKECINIIVVCARILLHVAVAFSDYFSKATNLHKI